MWTVTPRYDRVVLERSNELETRSVADVRQPRVTVTAEVALVDPSVGRAVEHCAPCLELAHAIGRFLGVDLRHAPVVHVLAAAHGVGKMHLPAVAIVVVGERRCHAAFGHHSVRLAQERLADETNRDAAVRGLDGSAQTRATRPDDEDVVAVRGVWHRVERLPRRFSGPSRSPSSTGGCRGRQTLPKRDCTRRTTGGASIEPGGTCVGAIAERML